MTDVLSQEVVTFHRNLYSIPLAGILRTEDDTLIQKGMGLGVKLYFQVERDNHVYAVLQKRKMAVAGSDWTVEPGGTSDLDKKAAEFVNGQLTSVNFDKLTIDLLDALLVGYSTVELIWERKGAEIVLTGFKPRDQRLFLFKEDEKTGKIDTRFLTIEKPYQGEELPDRKFLVYSWGARNGNPFGLGLGTRIYWPAWFKRQGMGFWLTFLDKFGMPTATAEIPATLGTKEKESLERAIQSIGRTTGMIIPQGVIVKLLESARSGTSDVFENAMRYFDEEISKAVLGETLSTSHQSSGGSQAATLVHNEVRRELTEADADLLDGFLNDTLVRWMVEFNFPGAAFPQVHRITKQEEDLAACAEKDKTLFDMGYRPTEEYVKEKYGDNYEKIEPPAEKVEEIKVGANPSKPAKPASSSGKPLAKYEGFSEPNEDDEYAKLEPWLIQAMETGGPELYAAVEVIRGIVMNATSMDTLRDDLENAFPKLDPDAFGRMMSRAMLAANLAGRFEVANGG